jgi:capsular exopolysaccharide synthesis family protein
VEKNLSKRSIFVVDKPKSSIAESFKILRTNVQFALKINDPKSILITSSGEGEGKTTVSINLAASFAKAGFKTLIIDTDLRIPMQHKIFELPNEIGLSSYLNGECNYKDTIRSAQIENLEIITAGPIPPNAAELLSSKKMPELMKLLKETYNIIICDSAPINVVADTQIISPLVDGTLVVVSAGNTRKAEFKKTLESLEYANIIGVVLNVITKSVDKYYYSYHYYNYYNKYYTS